MKTKKGRPKVLPANQKRAAIQKQITMQQEEWDLFTDLHDGLGLGRSEFVRSTLDYQWFFELPADRKETIRQLVINDSWLVDIIADRLEKPPLGD